MTERFNNLRSRIGRNPHPSSEWWSNGSRTLTSVVSFLIRVSTCSITRACTGPTWVGNTPLNRGGRDPNWILYPLSTLCKTHWDTFGRSFHTAIKWTKVTSLSRLASGVLGTTSSVPWSGGPAGNSWSSCSKHFFRGSEPLRTATFLDGCWERNSLEIAVPRSTEGSRGNGTISWGHWGEMGTVYWGVYRSSPEGPALPKS